MGRDGGHRAGKGLQGVQTEMLEGRQNTDYPRLVPRSTSFLCKQCGAQRNLLSRAVTDEVDFG